MPSPHVVVSVARVAQLTHLPEGGSATLPVHALEEAKLGAKELGLPLAVAVTRRRGLLELSAPELSAGLVEIAKATEPAVAAVAAMRGHAVLLGRQAYAAELRLAATQSDRTVFADAIRNVIAGAVGGINDPRVREIAAKLARSAKP